MFVVKRSGDRKLNLEVEDRDQIMVDPDREKKSDKAGLSMRGLYLYIRSRSRALKTVMMAMMKKGGRPETGNRIMSNGLPKRNLHLNQ